MSSILNGSRKIVQEGLRWRGWVRVTATYKDGHKEVQEWFENLIVDVGKNMMRDSMKDTAVQPKILFVALGNNATAPVVGDTTLVAEQFRKQVTSQSVGAVGEVTTIVYISPSEANSFTIEEIGWFADGATATADSGVMISRVLHNRTKTNLESLQIERKDTFS